MRAKERESKIERDFCFDEILIFKEQVGVRASCSRIPTFMR